jgi:WhiB family redox-sensing transcriptional regulator
MIALDLLARWPERACADLDTELFYPTGHGSTPADWRTPKDVCAGCVIRDECLTWALETGEPAGVWGGTDPEERRLLRLRRAKARRRAAS